MKNLVRKIALAAGIGLAASPVLIGAAAAPAQAAYITDLYNGDDRYSVHAWTTRGIGMYVTPRSNVGSAEIARLDIPYNMCYSYTIGGVSRTACGDRVTSVPFGSTTKVSINDAWFR